MNNDLNERWMSEDSDPLMRALLEADPAPDHSADFWSTVLGEVATTEPQKVRLRSLRASQRLGDGPLPLLVAAVLVLAVAIGGVVYATRDLGQRVTTDGSTSVFGDGADAPADAETGGVLPAPTAVEGAAIDQPGPTPVPIDGAALLPASSGQPPLADGSWRIGPGMPMGVSPDASVAWVRTTSPVGGSGCEGAPLEALWRIPFDGSTPSPASLDTDLANVTRLIVDGDRVVAVLGCDGVVDSFVLAVVGPGGQIADGRTISVGGELTPGITRIAQIEWQADGSLLVVTTDGQRREDATFERDGSLRSATTISGTADFLDDVTGPVVDQNGWRLENRNGFVHATPGAGGAFLGTPVHLDVPNLIVPAPLLMAEDLSGWFHTRDSSPCSTSPLIFTSFVTSIPVGVAAGARGGITGLTNNGDRLTTNAFCEQVISEDFPLDEIQRLIDGAPAERPAGIPAVPSDVPTPTPTPAADVPTPTPSPAAEVATDDLVLLYPPTVRPEITPIAIEATALAENRLRNERFEFSVSPPVNWTVTASQNGDGYTFSNGFSQIRVFGSFDVNGTIASAAFDSEADFALNGESGGTVATIRRGEVARQNRPGERVTQAVVFTPDGRVVVFTADMIVDDNGLAELVLSSLLVDAKPFG